MKSLVLLGYELLCVMLPFLLIFGLLHCKNQRHGAAATRKQIIFSLIFAFYVFGVFYVTGAGTLYDVLRTGIELRSGQLNLVPFSQSTNWTGQALNVVLFVPFGFLLPLAWPKTGRFFTIFCAGLGFSLLVELSQLLNHRTTDVDDLIMNTLGALLGYLFFLGFARITGRDARRTGPGQWQAWACLCAMFTGRFLLFNEFGLAGALYGF